MNSTEVGFLLATDAGKQHGLLIPSSAVEGALLAKMSLSPSVSSRVYVFTDFAVSTSEGRSPKQFSFTDYLRQVEEWGQAYESEPASMCEDDLKVLYDEMLCEDIGR